MQSVLLLSLLIWGGCGGVEKPGGLDGGGAGGAGGAPGCRGETYPREVCGVVFEMGPAWRCNPLPGGGPCVLNDGRLCVAVCP